MRGSSGAPKGTATALALATVLVAASGGGAVLAPVAYNDPRTGENVHHGVATEDTEDAWRTGGTCLLSYTEYRFELTVDEPTPPVLEEPVLELSALHIPPDNREGTRLNATATPGDPAVLAVVQGSSCYSFNVTAVDVDQAVSYRVTCSEGFCN
jgi:hypothetical protein